MKKIITIIILTFLVLSSSYIFTNTSSPGVGYSGAPGESNCSSCHSSTATSGVTWDSITLTSTVPISSFVGGVTYPITLRVKDPINNKFGFQLTALTPTASSSSPTLGTFSIPTGNTQIQLHSGLITGRTNVAHTAAGTSGTLRVKTWTFNWTAPTTISSTSVKFHVMVNSCNNNSSSSGDQPYYKTFTATVLSVQWLDFTLQNKVNTTILNWKTATEINNSHFEIENSLDKKDWIAIGSVKGNTNTNSQSAYKFETINNNQITYYRIKQVDFDGKFDYSKTIVSNEQNGKNIDFYWNETEKMLIFESGNFEKTITVYNLNGNIIIDQKLTALATNYKLDNLKTGIYLVKVNSNNQDYFRKILLY